MQTCMNVVKLMRTTKLRLRSRAPRLWLPFSNDTWPRCWMVVRKESRRYQNLKTMPAVKSLETQELLSVQSFPRHALVSPVLGRRRWRLTRSEFIFDFSLADPAPTAVLGHCLLELPGSYSFLRTHSRLLAASTETLN